MIAGQGRALKGGTCRTVRGIVAKQPETSQVSHYLYRYYEVASLTFIEFEGEQPVGVHIEAVRLGS